jgi:hypothetical protein
MNQHRLSRSARGFGRTFGTWALRRLCMKPRPRKRCVKDRSRRRVGQEQVPQRWPQRILRFRSDRLTVAFAARTAAYAARTDQRHGPCGHRHRARKPITGQEPPPVWVSPWLLLVLAKRFVSSVQSSSVKGCWRTPRPKMMAEIDDVMTTRFTAASRAALSTRSVPSRAGRTNSSSFFGPSRGQATRHAERTARHRSPGSSLHPS